MPKIYADRISNYTVFGFAKNFKEFLLSSRQSLCHQSQENLLNIVNQYIMDYFQKNNIKVAVNIYYYHNTNDYILGYLSCSLLSKKLLPIKIIFHFKVIRSIYNEWKFIHINLYGINYREDDFTDIIHTAKNEKIGEIFDWLDENFDEHPVYRLKRKYLIDDIQNIYTEKWQIDYENLELTELI